MYKRKKKSKNKTDLRDQKWEMHFYELKKFRKKFGHCDVPDLKYKNPYSSLARWCNHQRHNKKFSPLKYPPDWLRKLNEIGFSWNMRDKLFESNFRQLKEYHQKHGHCDVSKPENPKLVQWCFKLRIEHRMNVSRLTKERAARLNELGFNWFKGNKEQWELQFARLKEYKKKYGHCNVPLSRRNASYYYLSQWVQMQRKLYHNKNKRLTAERIEKLNSIEFNWINPLKSGNAYKHSDEDLLNELRRLHFISGKPPSIRYIDVYGKYSPKLYYTRFGSISFARKAAGIQGSPVINPNKHSDTELLDDLKRVATLIGKVPRQIDVIQYGKHAVGTYRLRFGQFSEACKKAGLL